jgi:hypothetical protein
MTKVDRRPDSIIVGRRLTAGRGRDQFTTPRGFDGGWLRFLTARMVRAEPIAPERSR